MAEEWAPGLFIIGVLVLVADGCDGRSSSRRVQATPPVVQEQVASYQPAPPGSELPWDDCQPGAPPASLANALDVLDARCDRARAIAIVASVGAMALPGGAARGALLRGTATRAAMARAGSAGAAVDGAIMSERMTAATARGARSYRVSPSRRDGYQVSPADDAGPNRRPYDVEAVDDVNYRVTRPGESQPLDVTVERSRGGYAVKPQDDRAHAMEGRRVRRDESDDETQVWEYKPE